MKMKCTEGTPVGELINIYYWIPEQEEVDVGKRPIFYVDTLNLLAAVEKNEVPEKSYGHFEIDALRVFMDEAARAQEAEVVAEWLEEMAIQIRAKFADKT